MFQLLCSVAFFGLIVASPTSRVHDGRIVGGEDIDITEAPYQVSLLYRGRHSCGGTLVANDIVLTAAHCIMGSDPTNYQIRAGSSYSEREGVVYPVGEILAHPDFSFSKMDNDVAIVWLSQPVTFSDRIAVVEMASQGDEVEDGELTEVTGWGNIREGGGIPTMLQRVLVPKVNSMACGKAYAPMYTITPRMLCAGAPGGGKDACQGDSGGPLIHNGKLTGVVSWGLGCARPEYPGVYAKVAALRRWIDEHILYLRLKNIMRW
ncbi:vitellin-degrading protease-like [Ostrinia nubilalis]|uniref:vitellin-degrading protease-like n=1 Tax=Ostrinia nubilalis TaxID=29057 RepID=UPI0030826705